MSGWRVFAGAWPQLGDAGSWSRLDARDCSWLEGKARLGALLSPFHTDECQDCREAGGQAYALLLALLPDTEFRAEVDGEVYMLVRDPS